VGHSHGIYVYVELHSKQINSRFLRVDSFYMWLAALISRWDSRFGGCELSECVEDAPDLHMGYIPYLAIYLGKTPQNDKNFKIQRKRKEK